MMAQGETRQPVLSEISRRRKLDLLLRELPAMSRILEVGPGDGWFTRRLAAHGHRVVTIDLVAKADYQGDINAWRTLGLAEASFQAVVALEVIEHVDCLQSLVSLLAPAGLLLLSSPHPRWDWVMKLLETSSLTQKRTSPHDHLIDFAALPRLDRRIAAVVVQRPAHIHQVGLFRKQGARAGQN